MSTRKQSLRPRRPPPRGHRRPRPNIGTLPMPPRANVGINLLRTFMQAPPQEVHTFVKWGPQTEINQSTGNVFGTYQFELNDLSEANAFAALYQLYRIKRIDMMFRPLWRNNSVATAAAYLPPLLYLAADVGNLATWTTLAQAQDNTNVTIVDDQETVTISLQPYVPFEVQSGSATPRGMLPSPWLSTNDTLIRHFGLNYAISLGGAGATEFQGWAVIFRYTVQFQNAQ